MAEDCAWIMEKLPAFIVEEILSYVHTSLQLTCKRWRYLMTPNLNITFSQPCLEPTDLSRAHQHLDKYGLYVKSIRCFVTADKLEGFLQRCPRLMAICILVSEATELEQVIRTFESFESKLMSLELSMMIRYAYIPQSFSSCFSRLNELAVAMDLGEAATQSNIASFKSSNLRILRIQLNLIHFSFVQSIPVRFPKLTSLSLVGPMLGLTVDRRRPPAFQNLKTLELEVYNATALDPLALFGVPNFNPTTLFISTECALDHDEVVAFVQKPWPALRALTLGSLSKLEMDDFSSLRQLTHLQLDFPSDSLTSVLGNLLESLPNLKSLDLTATIYDAGFSGAFSLPKLLKLNLGGRLSLGTSFMYWLFSLPFLQSLHLHEFKRFPLHIDFTPADFGTRTFPCLLKFELPNPSAFSSFVKKRAPNLMAHRFTPAKS